MRERDKQCPEHGDNCPYLDSDEQVIKRQRAEVLHPLHQDPPRPLTEVEHQRWQERRQFGVDVDEGTPAQSRAGE